VSITATGGTSLLRQIVALIFIFICTTVAWMILGSTVMYRTHDSDEQLKGRVGSTWGTPQEQSPPTATYSEMEIVPITTIENGKTIIHNNKEVRCYSLPLQSSHINANLNLDHRQKGLLWYSTYTVNFAADYRFQNDNDKPQTVRFVLPFPSRKAVYDGLILSLDGQRLALTTNDQETAGEATLGPKQTVSLHVGYLSHGLQSWRYKLAEGVAQVHDFSLVMRTNFRDIDFADDTLSPTSKQLSPQGWDLTWRYDDLISGFQIGMTMPEKLQPGPLAGQISYFAPVSLFFFFFLMFIIATMRNIELHPMNYFFLATAFFAFHLLLAYLVDHISIHAAMIIASIVSIILVVSYLRLVVGLRFAALEAGTAQVIYLVVFSYAFFWKGFTGLAVTVISIITLFIVMQVTGRIKWSEKFARPEKLPAPANAT
jgi:inner membrane protein involved in colicin E2 resistance